MARIPKDSRSLNESSGAPTTDGVLTEFDASWDQAAFRFALAASERENPFKIEARLEQFLRAYVAGKVRRFARSSGGAQWGLAPEDVAQRLFLKLIARPPRFESPEGAMKRLTAWVRVTVERDLVDLVAKQRELLEDRSGRTSRTESVASGALFARLELAEVEALLKKEYPAGLALLRLLALFPDATSYELAEELGTSIDNVDQMRFRIRRALRRHTGGAR